MARAALSSSLAVLRDLAGVLEEGVLALSAEHVVLLAAGQPFQLLGVPGDGVQLSSALVDFRLLRLLDAARSSATLQEREIDVADRRLAVRALAVGDDDVAILVLARDVTRVRHLERVRRDFITNVSHELRTPVTAIRLMAETLESGGLADPEAAEDFVRRIGLEATHMTQMLEELLELSSIESGLRPLAQAPVPLDALLTMVDRLRPLADAKRLHVKVRIAPGTPAILGDAASLGQVLRNLVHNAIKFTPQGGAIDIEAEAGAHATVMLRCRDTGVGIAPTDLHRIFERFWKADSSRQRDGEGSGLGLAIVRHVVEAHGGTVQVSSEPRRGTVFTVVLPAASGG